MQMLRIKNEKSHVFTIEIDPLGLLQTSTRVNQVRVSRTTNSKQLGSVHREVDTLGFLYA